MIVFQNILFLKELFACNGCFWLFTKIKKGFGTSYWCTFSAWFFRKNVWYLILYQLTKFQCHTFFPSQDIKQNLLLSLILTTDDVINFKVYLWSSSKTMVDRGKKGEDRNTKIWEIQISREQKELFRWNKKNFT